MYSSAPAFRKREYGSELTREIMSRDGPKFGAIPMYPTHQLNFNIVALTCLGFALLKLLQKHREQDSVAVGDAEYQSVGQEP